MESFKWQGTFRLRNVRKKRERRMKHESKIQHLKKPQKSNSHRCFSSAYFNVMWSRFIPLGQRTHQMRAIVHEGFVA